MTGLGIRPHHEGKWFHMPDNSAEERAVTQAPQLRDLPPSDRARPRPDLVLVTVNENETKAIHDAFLEATGSEGVPVSLDGRLYNNLGAINGTTVYHVISEMGTSGPGAMQQAVDKAIRALEPGAVIAIGIAFGVSEADQSIGDILLSKQIQLYDLQRAGSQIVLRGDKAHATPRLINHFDTFSQIKWKGAKVRPGLILSGEKLIDNKDYRDQLLALQSEAVGGEMEGAGLYVASADHKVDWIVIKAICDWADGNKGVNKKQRQKKAAKNAASFLVQSLKYAALKRIDQSSQFASSSIPPSNINPVSVQGQPGQGIGLQEIWHRLAELLRQNYRAFHSFGPPAGRTGVDRRLWQKQKAEVITPNNKSMSELLRTHERQFPESCREIVNRMMNHLDAYELNLEVRVDYKTFRLM